MNTEVTVNQVIKSVGKNSLIYGFSTALQPLAGFILLPLYSKYFEPSDYGIYTLIVLISTIFSTVFHLGINSAFARSYYDYENEEDRRRVFNTSFLLLIVGLILQVGICLLVSRHLSIAILDDEKYANLLVISVTSTAIVFLNTGLFNYLRVREKSLTYTVFSIISLVLSVSLTWYFLEYVNQDISSPIYSSIIVQSFILITLILFHYKLINLFDVNKKEIRILLQFGLPSIFAGIAVMIGEWADKFLINEFLTKSELGIFSMAFRIALLYNVIIAVPFALVWNPLMMKLRTHQDIVSIFNRVTFLYFGMSSLFIFGVYLFLEPVLTLLSFDNKFADSFSYIPLLMTAVALGSLQNIYSAGIIYARKPILIVYVYFFAGAINFICSYFAIIKFGLWGATFTFIVFKLISSLLIYFVSSKYFSFKIFSTEYIKLILLYAIIISIYLEYILGELPFILQVLYVFTSCSGLLYFLFRKEFVGIISRLRNKSYFNT